MTPPTSSFPPEDERIVAEDPDFPPPGAPQGPVDLSPFTLHMVGHAHIDLGYRWNQAETVHHVAPWTFRGVLDLLDSTPGFTFCQSQLWLYEAMRREHPELFARIRAGVRAGAWEVVGGAWCEYDAILPSGEAVIRQHLHGVRYAREVLGVEEHEVAFVPDSFCGHAATLPQILAGCGFRYYLFGRGLPQDPEAPEKTRRAFRWVGPDGSSVIAFLPFGPYATGPLTPEYLPALGPYARASVSDQELVLHGQGDHGGGPRQAEIDALHALQRVPGAPRWRFSTVHAACRAAFGGQTTAALAEHRGNLGGFATGALTSQAQAKRRNRQLEKEMLAAEATAVVGTLLSRKPAFPRVEVRDLWRRLLGEQFHDILPGTSVAGVYRDTHAAYDAVAQGAQHLLADGFARIRARLDTCGEGACLVAYNPGLLPVRTPVGAALPSWLGPGLEGASHLVDGAGTQVPCHRQGDGILFLADLPPLSYRAFRLLPGPPGLSLPRAPTFAAGVLESPHFRLTFDMATGDLVGMVDRRDGRPVLRGASNALGLHGEMGIATAWVQAFSGERVALKLVEPPRLTESNPFYTRVATTSRSRASTFRREVTVYSGVDRVDFRLLVDWHEGNHFLKLGFAPALAEPRLRAALAHGSAPVPEPAREFCLHDFVHLADAQGGLALLNDGAYGCSFAGGRLGLSVIRTARDMDPQMAHGRHELRYAVYPCPAATPDSALLAQAASLEGRVLCAFEPGHPGGLKSWGAYGGAWSLPPEHAFVSLGGAGAVLCAFKIPEEDWLPLSFVVRVRDADGDGGPCVLELPAQVSAAVEVDHLERERPGGVALEWRGRRVFLRLGPYEIRTVLARA
ncbi:MAG: glycoside hydrolase family 38 C-terminal domain-containing protein [Candidatus Latescibacterota bacterium]